MSRYMLTERFRDLTIMPAPDVDALEALEGGWLQRRIDRWGARIDAKLRKRYAVPFGAEPVAPIDVRVDVPLAIEDWVVALVTLDAYQKRGFNPSSEMDSVSILTPATTAQKEIDEAANSETGLFELPMRASSDAGGVTKGGVLSYTEASPFVWTDVQAQAGREEDRAREGSL